MTKKMLGRLEKVVLREVWGNDTSDFVAWLRQPENLNFLGGAVGRRLIVAEQPLETEWCKVDLCCRDADTSELMLVKVQFDDTSDDQLGQLLTGATGADQVMLVWIADRITDEHKSAVNWLNEITSDGVNWFGLEIDFWRIAESAMAPTVTLVCKPNGWVKTSGDLPPVRSSTRASSEAASEAAPKREAVTSAPVVPSAALERVRKEDVDVPGSAAERASSAPIARPSSPFLEYWLAFNGHLLQRKSTVIGQKPTAANWMAFPLGGPHFKLIATTNPRDSYVAVGLVLSGEEAKTHFHLLQHSKVAIENEIGATLEWQELPEKEESRILLRRYGTDPDDRAQWEEQHNWLAERLEKFQKTFVLRVEALNVDEEFADALDDTQRSEERDDLSVPNLTAQKKA